MSDKSDYLEGAVLDYFFNLGAAAPARPTQLKVALCTAATDTETPAVTEAAYAGYARVNVTMAGTVASAGGKKSSSTTLVQFAALPAGGGSFTHYQIIDNGTGSVLVTKAIPGGPIACNEGDIPQFAIAALSHTES